MNSASQLVQSPGDVSVEIFTRPSDEARRLLRWFGWLIAPSDGVPRWYHRLFGFFCIAPFTQLTFVSFELQAFLHSVFHTTRIARWGHLLFMPVTNFFVMVLLASFRSGASPATNEWTGPSLSGATVYAAVLLAWYFAIAHSERLYLWWVVMVPITLGLGVGADWYWCVTHTLGAHPWYAPTALAFNPWLWMSVAAFLVAVSHLPEPNLPPRFGHQFRWTPLRDYFLGPPDAPLSGGRIVKPFVLAAVQTVSGTMNEWWASPRLMPYNFLVLMLRAGYRPDVAERLRSNATRALASGNPAVDFVGIGGGAFLVAEPESAAVAAEPLPT